MLNPQQLIDIEKVGQETMLHSLIKVSKHILIDPKYYSGIDNHFLQTFHSYSIRRQEAYQTHARVRFSLERASHLIEEATTL